MKDLQRLAHHIESKLYSGDRLKLYISCLVTRWLSKLCKETYDDQEQWMKLVEFLEKDLKVQRQKMLIQEKSNESRNNKQNSDGK